MRKMRAIVVIALAAGATLALTAPASGHFLSAQRSIEAGLIPGDGPPFTAVTGRVTSTTTPRCRKNSRVTFFKVQPGADQFIGSRLTTRAGYFTIPAPNGQFEDGDYYLVVKRKILVKNRFHKHRCPRLQTGSATIDNA
jgi:hypothetical protein